MNIGDFRTRLKLSAQLYLADIATPTKFTDFGNVLLVKSAHKIDRAQQVTAAKGHLRVTHEEPGKVELRWDIKVDEHQDELVRLFHLADGATAANQSSGTGASWTATVAIGYSYYVGAMGISSFAISGKTAGTDYTIDLNTGMFKSLTITGETTATFNKAALNFNTFTAMTEMFRRVAVRMILTDQNADTPRQIVTFNGEVHLSDAGEFAPDKFNEAAISLLAVSDPVILNAELA